MNWYVHSHATCEGETSVVFISKPESKFCVMYIEGELVRIRVESGELIRLAIPLSVLNELQYNPVTRLIMNAGILIPYLQGVN